jgi:NDP-sugar pyrophosphorylase family protein
MRMPEIDPGAMVGPKVLVRDEATIGPNASIEGKRIYILGSASVDNVTIAEDNVRIDGDASIESDDHWFTDEDEVAPFKWTVYRTTRTWPDGSRVWQACAACVRMVDLHSEMDFTDTSIYVDGAEHAPAREIQRDRVLAEIARREI